MKSPKKPLDRVREIAEALNHMDEASRNALLERVAAKDPRLASEIQKRMVVFEDLIRLEGGELQKLIRQLPPGKLALALKTARDELKEHFFKGMSRRAAEILKEEVSTLGPQKKSAVEAAQAEIAAMVKNLGLVFSEEL